MATSKDSLEENTCPICMYILIQPVTMPCNHELCLPCFKQNVEEANFCCPMCRLRISTWTRKASRNKALVNQERWKEIMRLFPERVNKRLNGEEDDDLDGISLNALKSGNFSHHFLRNLVQCQASDNVQRTRTLTLNTFYGFMPAISSFFPIYI